MARLVTAASAALLLGLVAGCSGGSDNAALNLTPAASATITIAAPGLPQGARIPAEYTCDGADLSPELSWQGAPGDRKVFVLLMDDPDAGGFVHWLVYDIPSSVTSLARGQSPDQTLPNGAKQGKNGFGKTGYGGPCPPKGSPHTYRFRIFALDAATGVSPGASASDVINAMAAHQLAAGEFDRAYGR